MTPMRSLVFVLAAAAVGCGRPPSLLQSTDPRFAEAAPDSFDVEMITTKGTMLVRAHRTWSPHGADRFHALVRYGFFTDVAFRRTISNFGAQFCIHGDTAVNRAWMGRSIPDDTVRTTNRRGTLSFARGGPNTRGTQLFFNLVDNTPRLDTLNGFGFPPIGEIVQGVEVLDSLNWEYSGVRGGTQLPGPRQDSLRLQGNDYLRRNYPRLDYIRSARVVRSYDR